MMREISERIVEAMKGVDLALDRLDASVRAIEDEAERKRILHFMAGFIHDLQFRSHFPSSRITLTLTPICPACLASRM